MPQPPSYETELFGVLQSINRAATASPLGEESTDELETTQSSEESNEVPGPPILAVVSKRTLFSHPDAHPVVLDLALLQAYGADWLEWEAETLQIRIPQDIGPLSDLNLSKVMANKTLHLVDTYWENWEVFIWCTMPFCGFFPDFDVMQVPTVAQCSVSVDIAGRLRSDAQWSSEMKDYLASVHRHDGIFVTQSPLEFVEVDKSGVEIDEKEVQRRWPSVRMYRRAPTEMTQEAEQLRRMLTVYEYLSDSRARLQSQLSLVQHA